MNKINRNIKDLEDIIGTMEDFINILKGMKERWKKEQEEQASNTEK